MLLLDKVKKASAEELKSVKKCAVGYSGGLDSTAMIMLLEKLGIETTAVVLDIGQGKEKFERARKLAGVHASKSVAIDARGEFYSNINRGIIANTMFNGHVNSEGLSRPIIALHLARIAKENGCDAIAHGSSGTGNDQHRMENGLRALAPWAHVIAPVRDWDLRREECAQFLAKEGLKETSDGGSTGISADESMWARTIRGVSETADGVPKSAYKWVGSKTERAIGLEFRFVNGALAGVKADGKAYNGYDAFEALNPKIGQCGFGKFMSFEDKVIGLKMAEHYEAPLALAAATAHKLLERQTLTRCELDVKVPNERVWAKLVYEGNFYSRLRANLDAFLSEQSRPVTGTVRAEIAHGGMDILDSQSPNALYDSRLTNRRKGGAFDQKGAMHFSRLYGLQ
ncbi:MAG TPA: argininosuccinate synthase, partial [Candidatus Micrarchaeota archaeon]|nr:argininosuccinate synthase [Candidatus Micrarchaeota archaeon]